jgi:phage shock protein E
MVIIDIRDEEEFLSGHIPGARHTPLQELQFALREVEPEEKVIVVCRTGQRAQQVKALLEHEGFTNVEVLEGGMAGYKGEIVQGE